MSSEHSFFSNVFLEIPQHEARAQKILCFPQSNVNSSNCTKNKVISETECL